MGYCQGLNYIACSFFKVCNQDEEKTFLIMLSFIVNKQLKGMYMPQVYEYHLKNHVLQGLFKTITPAIHKHLIKKLQINLEMVTTQWVMTLFQGYAHDRRVILPIFDNFILENNEPRTSYHSWRLIYSYILSLFQVHEEQLLNMSDIS